MQRRGDALHCRPGDEILAHASAHIIAREGGAHAALGGFQITPLPGDDGQFAPETFRAALHPRSRYQPPQTVVSVEQTANIGGGTIWKKKALDEVVRDRQGERADHPHGWRAAAERLRRDKNIGARYGRGMGSAWIDFSKGLGAPIGGVIAGSRAFIDDVWRWKQRLGGSMRQAGICGGRLRLRARPSCRPPRRRSRQCAGAGARAVADRRRRGAAARDQSGVFQA